MRSYKKPGAGSTSLLHSQPEPGGCATPSAAGYEEGATTMVAPLRAYTISVEMFINLHAPKRELHLWQTHRPSTIDFRQGISLLHFEQYSTLPPVQLVNQCQERAIIKKTLS